MIGQRKEAGRVDEQPATVDSAREMPDARRDAEQGAVLISLKSLGGVHWVSVAAKRQDAATGESEELAGWKKVASEWKERAHQQPPHLVVVYEEEENAGEQELLQIAQIVKKDCRERMTTLADDSERAMRPGIAAT